MYRFFKNEYLRPLIFMKYYHSQIAKILNVPKLTEFFFVKRKFNVSSRIFKGLNSLKFILNII